MALERISKVGSSGISTTVSFRSTGITVTGIVTATSFVGDGSGLTGVVGSGSGVVIKDDNATVGTASTINFGSNLSVSAISAGIVTVTATDTNTTYTQSAVSDSSNVRLRLSGSDSTTDDILLTAGSNITFSSVTDNGFTISAAGGGGGGSIVGIDTTGTSFFNRLNISGVATANSFVKSGGTSSQFLKADGTVDSSTYLTSYTETDTLNTVTGRGNSTLNGISVGILTSTTLNVGTGGTVITTTSNGLVGIGTATPTSVLDVTGDAKISSGLQVTGITTLASYVGPVSTWTVTGNGSSYFFSGPGFDGTETNPTLYLVRGQKYRFNGTAGHPIRIQSTPTGTSYDAGVTNNSTATVDFNVQDDAPDVLFYQCTIHSGMRGRIFITGKRIVEGSWTAVAGTLTNIDTITGISTNKFRTAEYTLHFENSASGIQAQKVLVMQDINNATAYSQEYGVMYQPNLLVSVGSSISGGSFFLNATPETGISGVTTYRYTRELIQ